MLTIALLVRMAGRSLIASCTVTETVAVARVASLGHRKTGSHALNCARTRVDPGDGCNRPGAWPTCVRGGRCGAYLWCGWMCQAPSIR